MWLLKRGIWLILVEITIMKLAWNFNLNYSIIVLQVIWALGASILFLAAFIHLPKKIMVIISLVVIFGHNAFDNYLPGTWTSLWTVLHIQGPVVSSFNTIFIAYPLIPWIFVMLLGYHFGMLYHKNFNVELRKKWLRILGIGLIVLFIFFRAINIHGDPMPWSNQDSMVFTFLSFVNVAKYPPSLLFLLITLGPAILLLSFTENWKGKIHDALVTIGRVPMFFYIIHVYIIHLFALLAVVVLGFSPNVMIIALFVTFTTELQGYGFNLWVVYAVWTLLILGLYPICKWYWDYKNDNRDKWWLSYL